MMKPKFTPGPWRVAANARSVGVYTRSGDRVVLVPVVTTGQGRAQANADLIAAAPDMYEALQGLLSHVTGLTLDADDHPSMQRAREALAKAEGR